MDRRFAARREELLADAEVAPEVLRGLLPRLERFLTPFVASLQRREQDEHARHYVAGLVSNLEYKNVESIAYLHDQPGRTHLEGVISQCFTATKGRKTAHFRHGCRRNPLFFGHFEMRLPWEEGRRPLSTEYRREEKSDSLTGSVDQAGGRPFL